jgi:glycosyltransferase involved in cell wall biosynthesis
MHLIVLENEPSSCRGGQELSLFDVCQSLHQRGHDITLLYTKPGDLLEKYQSLCLNTIPVYSYRMDRNQWLKSVRAFYQSVQKLSSFEYSLVYSNQYQDSLFGCSLAALKRIPFVCHLRLPFPTTLGLQARLGLHGATRLITISHQTKATWSNAGFSPQKLDVVYNGIDLNRFKPTTDLASAKQRFQLAPETKVISYVGRLDKVKGVETLLHAVAQLLPHHPNLRLLIAGKPLIQSLHYQETLQQLAITLNIQPQVKFLGHVTNPLAVYQASDIVVLPSLWDEPFGRTLLEAMACGVPAVASRVGGIPEVLAGEFEQGLFRAGDRKDLADTLNRLIDWREADSNLGVRSRQYVADHFRLEKAVDGIEQVMLSALSQRR